MRKLLLFLLFASYTTWGCDLCGCSNSNSFFGLMPASNRGFLGVRYRTQSFDSHIGSSYLASHEQFQSTEVWGRFYPVKNIQVLGFLPYNMHSQQTSTQKFQVTGLGDPSFLIQYNLINTLLDTTYRELNHNLLVGAGLKLPLGKFRYDTANPSEVANANFQLGTGSIDFTIQSTYGIRYQAWGLNFDGQVKLTGTNPEEYKFGNRISGATTLFYAYGKGHRITLMPYANLYAEYSTYDKSQGQVNTRTGGSMSLVGLGIECTSRKAMFGTTIQTPIIQQLSGGEIKANNRISAHFTFLF
ncbi:hypothetical protein [Aquirufa regiilacus]|uniref:Transporter n=1 Tax=Aquirufa regiilacus TaxID=3024868 RepID=A0ABU3TPA5_9BACT|nr:hypothetical protein [Aquirufa sp. LEOWEIH-7C]MDU0807692.1 hypothetical protein [Aquirufa sp. LEOWEIH-7C]